MPPPIPHRPCVQINKNNPLVPPLSVAFLLLLCRVIDATKAKEVKDSAGALSKAEKAAYELLRNLARQATAVGPNGSVSTAYILLLCVPFVRCLSLLLSIDREYRLTGILHNLCSA